MPFAMTADRVDSHAPGIATQNGILHASGMLRGRREEGVHGKNSFFLGPWSSFDSAPIFSNEAR
jgi:hypothetical protein